MVVTVVFRTIKHICYHFYVFTFFKSVFCRVSYVFSNYAQIRLCHHQPIIQRDKSVVAQTSDHLTAQRDSLIAQIRRSRAVNELAA